MNSKTTRCTLQYATVLLLVIPGLLTAHGLSSPTKEIVCWDRVPSQVIIHGRLQAPLCTLLSVKGKWGTARDSERLGNLGLSFEVIEIDGVAVEPIYISKDSMELSEFAVVGDMFPGDVAAFGNAKDGQVWSVVAYEKGVQNYVPSAFYERYCDGVFPGNRVERFWTRVVVSDIHNVK